MISEKQNAISAATLDLYFKPIWYFGEGNMSSQLPPAIQCTYMYMYMRVYHLWLANDLTINDGKFAVCG